VGARERSDDEFLVHSLSEGGRRSIFGRPIGQTSIACPRGWGGTDDRPADGYLATYAVNAYATPTNPAVYIHNCLASTTTFELRRTSGRTVAELAAVTETSAGVALIGHSRSFYDGTAFVGLPLGQIGRHGALTRSEALALTGDVLQQAYGTDVPPYLEPTGAPLWTTDHPTEFRSLLARRAGYAFHAGTPSPTDPRGYFITTERRRYDVHNDPDGRGLVLETLDPLHDAAGDPSAHRVMIGYDEFRLLPTTVTDAAALTTTAVYDYRVLQPTEVTDVNGNTTRFTYSPLGLLASLWVRGKAAEGDQLRPSLRLEYGFLAFESSPPGARQPIYVRIMRHARHDTEAGVPLPARDETITTVEYSDGFGRLLQTRTQDDDVRFGEVHFGGGDAVLPSAQSGGPGGNVVGRLNSNAAEPNVVVSGWQIYDNKGQVVQRYEPFFSEGWAYGQPADEQRGEKLTRFYDPRGHAIRTLMPDGSEHLVVQGVPGTIAAPDVDRPEIFEPTPWEAYSYDANDNAGRTHPLASAGYRHHWNTPSSIRIDALGRTIETIERNREAPMIPAGPPPPIEELRIETHYDIRGNVLTVIDAIGRPALKNALDLFNRTLRIESIDAGWRRSVPDAGGGVVETRAGNGSLALAAYDRLNRPIRLWARDGAGQPLTLRERLEYGDASAPNQPLGVRAAARTANQLGRLSHVFDEAGQLSSSAYDFKGNLLEKTRRVVSDAAVLGVFAGPPPGWNVQAHRVDWTDPAGTPLDPSAYTSTLAYDALNRVTRLTYPEDVEHARRESVPVYSRSGALRSVALAGDTFVERIAYSAKGQRVLIAYGNGVMTRYAYDLQTFRLLRVRTEQFSVPASLTYRPTGALLQDLAYEYDLVGNILAIHDRTPNSGINGTPLGPDALDRTFAYDAMYRLRSATGRECDRPPDVPWDDSPRCTDLTKTRSYIEQYVYDSVGNIEQFKHLANGAVFNRDFEGVPGNNRLSKVTVGATPFDYQYDANGNMTGETTSRHFEWDYTDRMRVFRTQTDGSEPTVHAHYFYDAGGQRVKKLLRKQGGRVEVTVYIDGVLEYQRIVQGSAVDENNTLHVMNNQSRIAMVRVGNPFVNDTTPAVKYHLGDHLGSSNLVIDASGSLVNREEFTPYGDTSFGSFARKRYRFSGKERDNESGLNYHGARYYAAWLCKWTSCDPLGSVNGLSLFVYTCNPLSFIDPDGMETTSEITITGVSNPETIAPGGHWEEGKPGKVDPASGNITTTEQIWQEEFQPAISRKEAVEAAERKGQVGGQDIAHFGKGVLESIGRAALFIASGPLYGPLTLFIPQSEPDPTYGGAELIGRSVGAGVVAGLEGAVVSGHVGTPRAADVASEARALTLSERVAERRAAAEAKYGPSRPYTSTSPRNNVVNMARNSRRGEFTPLYTDYPAGAKRPPGPVRLLPKSEYDPANAAKQAQNAALRNDPRYEEFFEKTWADIHEPHPVKWGGDPIDIKNKEIIPPPEHWEITAWWNALQRWVQGK
jgi:RHS repeat-associated protein